MVQGDKGGALIRDCLRFLRLLFGDRRSGAFLTLTCVANVLPVGGVGSRSTLGGFHRFAVLGSGRLAECFNFARSRIGGLYVACSVSFRSVGT